MKRKNVEINQTVVDNFERYRKIKLTPKTISGQYLPLAVAETHPDCRDGDASVHFAEDSEKGRLNVSLNVERTKSFRFRLFCDDFMRRPCYRFESDGGSHENPPSPDCPLSKRSIPTPHFHRYDEEGRNVAYRTTDLERNESEYLADLDKAFAMFCAEENIVSQEGFHFRHDRSLFEKTEFCDPLEGVSFP